MAEAALPQAVQDAYLISVGKTDFYIRYLSIDCPQIAAFLLDQKELNFVPSETSSVRPRCEAGDEQQSILCIM